MSSLVCFPFKEEDVPIFVRNIEAAASHERVASVICVGYSRGETWQSILADSLRIEAETGKKIELVKQKRIASGGLRAGKGDGMNTALEYFLEHLQFSRLHFYDADISSFTREWITKAEVRADSGDIDVVRHYYPRSSTDAMITWFVTKVGFALLWPRTILPAIEQPLGGELSLSRKAVEVLFADRRVRDQADWGVDTLYTFITAQAGLSLAEVYIPEGKVHSLYNGLGDLKRMLVECFAAMQSLRHEEVTSIDGRYSIQPAQPVPDALKQKFGYNVEMTLKLMRKNWTPRQWELVRKHFDHALAAGLQEASEWPCWSWADEAAWIAAYQVFLTHFRLGDTDWEEILFKVWVARVLNYTCCHAVWGYDAAISQLRNFVSTTRKESYAKVKLPEENGRRMANGTH